MAKETINNSEGGLSVRTKLNNMFTELYGSVSSFVSNLANKVDKEAGKSLVLDTEIAKIHASGSDDETTNSILQKIGDGSKISANYIPGSYDDVIDLLGLLDIAPTGSEGAYYYNTVDKKIYYYTYGSWSDYGNPETGKLYADVTTNLIYRWSGSILAVTSTSLALGETSATAYRGDRGKTAYDHSQSQHAANNADNTQTVILGSTNKDALVDADKIAIIDTEDTNAVKTTTWTNIKAKIATYLQGIALSFSQLITFTTAPKLDITVLKSALVMGTDASGNIVPTQTINSTMSMAALTDFPGLDTESNWVANATNAVSGSLGDRAAGVGTIGCFYECAYTQFGWHRELIQPVITHAALIAALQTSGNWTKISDTVWSYNAIIGDVEQEYYWNGYTYRCINGSTHTWLRIGNLETVIISDTAYIPKPQVEVGKADNGTFVIAAKYDITSIVVEAETTTAGNFSIGSSDGASDIVASMALPTTIGQKKRLTYIVNTDYPMASNRTMYINIDSAATVKLHIITQKMFE